MSAILRISGESMKPEEVASCSKLVPYRTDKAGAGRAKLNTLHYLITDDADSIDSLLASTFAYLEKHFRDIQPLVSANGVKSATIDIAIEFKEAVAAKFVALPNAILRQFADLGLDLEISVYRAE